MMRLRLVRYGWEWPSTRMDRDPCSHCREVDIPEGDGVEVEGIEYTAQICWTRGILNSPSLPLLSDK